MSVYPNDILIHFWLCFMLILAGGVWRTVRYLRRRSQIASGERK